MLNAIIQFALHRRAVVLCIALTAIVLGSIAVKSLPIDVLPDLTRPRVTIITECMGMAPEEVEREVTVPLEAAVNGAAGVIAVRSKSDVGLSVINVEFDWGTDIYRSRQIVSERMSLARDQIPARFQPRLGPLSSLLGQVMLIGMWSETGETDPLDIRTLADWTVKKRLQQIPGISEVITMGGGRKQYHVLIDLHELHKYDIALSDIERALKQSNINVNGGYVDQNSREFLVRGIGRINQIEELRRIVVRQDSERAVLLEHVATIEPLAQVKRGDATINGKPGVVLTIQKQPTADTRLLSDAIVLELEELRKKLPTDIKLEITYEQREFIDHSVGNVIDALRDGSILVVLVLFLFLFNVRTTLITLTAIPVSILVTALVFQYFQLSINVMTLGGIAIALGELVDDAIVDVENIFRRLKQNSRAENPRPILKVIFEASVEVRNAIIISTILVIVVFSPLFALSGISGRMFIPLGVAYLVSIVASTLVSLTLTPVLSYFLLARTSTKSKTSDSFIVRGLKGGLAPMIKLSMTRLGFSMLFLSTIVSVVVCVLMSIRMGQEWIPKFDEGAMQMNMFADPGTSLATSLKISSNANIELAKLVHSEENPAGFIRYYTGRTGRAENDEHVMGVNTTEYTISLIENHGKTRQEVIEILEETAALVPDVGSETDQPIAHLISHLISGSTAQIAVKIFGDDLDTLVRKGTEIRDAISQIKGIKPPKLEQQQLIPQLRIEPDYEQLAAYKLTAGQVFEVIEIAMQGRVVSQMVERERTFDIVIRFPERYRENFEELGRIPIDLPDGGSIPLSTVANIYQYGGPNTINHENSRRRIIVRVYTDDSDLATAVADIRKVVEKVELPENYFVQYGGQFEAQQEATQQILILSIVALFVVFVILYSSFSSINIVFQILVALPVAFVGGILALNLTGQVFTTSAMVGFISLGGIAARNGLLLVSTYLNNSNSEGEITYEKILEGSLERMTPVLMTALTTGIGLLPLIISGSLPGREILYPVATVIVGGLITSTLCEFLIRPGLFYFFGPTRKLKENDCLE
ncbi:MAG: efflux RND transporter permease subunit [Mariniblastus sp.]|nr:efflux RND transporter permease subunit [Mariniblastus sp.]